MGAAAAGNGGVLLAVSAAVAGKGGVSLEVGGAVAGNGGVSLEVGGAAASDGGVMLVVGAAAAGNGGMSLEVGGAAASNGGVFLAVGAAAAGNGGMLLEMGGAVKGSRQSIAVELADTVLRNIPVCLAYLGEFRADQNHNKALQKPPPRGSSEEAPPPQQLSIAITEKHTVLTGVYGTWWESKRRQLEPSYVATTAAASWPMVSEHVQTAGATMLVFHRRNLSKDCSDIEALLHACIATDHAESGFGAIDYTGHHTPASMGAVMGIAHANRMHLLQPLAHALPDEEITKGKSESEGDDEGAEANGSDDDVGQDGDDDDAGQDGDDDDDDEKDFAN